MEVLDIVLRICASCGLVLDAEIYMIAKIMTGKKSTLTAASQYSEIARHFLYIAVCCEIGRRAFMGASATARKDAVAPTSVAIVFST